VISTPSIPEQKFIKWFNANFKDNNISTFAEQVFLPFLPKFMYFSEYQKMPGRIAIDKYIEKASTETLSANEKVFEALLSLANTSVAEIKEAKKLEDLINKTRGVSSKITREIFSYWSQNKHLKVDFRCDMAKPGDEAPFNSGYVFSTRIENTRHDSTVSFDERSAGFVWFFSFLIWFNKLQKENRNLFVLLDEPGLTLHAKAQADLIRFFKDKITPKFQLIYTTHSPFMLDFSDILSARTVEDATGDNDEVLGTKVGSRVLSKDKDTVFPLQAAFGYDITQTLFIGKNTLLVEGPSDILYLHYFSNLLEKLGRTSLSKAWTVCPSGGIDKIQSFVSLFGGNALKVASLTDYHEGDRK
jgi:predicted ATP-dependent endonuclease of OLD family